MNFRRHLFSKSGVEIDNIITEFIKHPLDLNWFEMALKADGIPCTSFWIRNPQWGQSLSYSKKPSLSSQWSLVLDFDCFSFV